MMSRKLVRVWAAALPALALLAACGGDDAGTAPPPNQPPGFGNASFDISYPENSTAVVITLTVTDETASSVVLSLSGPDANRFTIANGRDLVFVTPPDFENPTDAGANNVYNVTVTARDNLGSTNTVDITVTVTNDPTAMRFVDPVFTATTTLGTVAMTTPSGSAPITFIAPAGDMLSARPLVVVGGSNLASVQGFAGDLALRGYLVGMTPATGSGDLFALASAMGNGAYPAFGFDREAIGVAAPFEGGFDATFRNAGIATYGFGTDVGLANTAALQFHRELVTERP